jgi:alcohol dehydrogenase
MRAAAFDSFCGPITVRDLPDPEPEHGDAIVRVHATGLCRSDWHGWQGHDPDISNMPHVPGHELAGEVAAVGGGVTRWKVGDRVTVPFVAGCGRCEPCRAGNQQVCDAQSQPGFTHWGSFAELVRIRYAEDNLVTLPPELDYVTAAALGCRFTTAYRAVVAQGRVKADEWVAVHGCGGVGLSAVMIARSLGARVLAVDVNPAALELATSLGAEATVDGGAGNVAAAVVDATAGGAHLSVDALGHPAILWNSVSSLRKLGRHVQVGLLLGGEAPAPVPMDLVVARELEVIGSHGMQARLFPGLFELILAGQLDPARLVTRTCTLAEGAAALAALEESTNAGITVIDRLTDTP